MRFNSLATWLHWLEGCHPQAIDLGLDRVAIVARTLNISFPESKIVSVAGTNGKGSCVAAMNAVLRHAGYRVGCYTSPHLLRFNERIVEDDQPLDDDTLIRLFDCVENARGDVSLTYFEFTTLAALLHFRDSKPDVLLLEVGLGGRLDAVNIVDADVAVITSIDIDHTDWLGDNREQIGFEKAGIFRGNQVAVCGDPQPPASIAKRAQDFGTKLLQRNEDFSVEFPNTTTWSWRGQGATGPLKLENLALPVLPIDSVVSALQALHSLNLPMDESDYVAAIPATLPARLQTIILNGKTVLIDVAHNPAAAAYLADRLSTKPCVGRTLAVIAIMADKDCAGVVAPMLPIVDMWYPASLPGNPRALAVEGLAAVLTSAGATVAVQSDDVVAAVNAALNALTPADRLIVFGSFYTVADILALAATGENLLNE